MPEIILFRFHRDFPVCEQTLRQLRRLNPFMEIHGLFGGPEVGDVPASLLALLDSNWVMPSDDAYYKWRNGDLCARAWFRDHGRQIEFTHAYFLEWDMLFARPLRQIYGPLQPGANYATMFGNYADAQQTGWWWLTGHYGMETSWLLEHLAASGRTVDLTSLRFGYMGAAVFSRQFLEKFAAEPVPSYSNDELRFSVYSRAFDIPLLDNGIHGNAAAQGNRFHAENYELSEQELDSFIAARGAVLHPLRFLVADIDARIALER